MAYLVNMVAAFVVPVSRPDVCSKRWKSDMAALQLFALPAIMDRNLGAMSAEVGNYTAAAGLFYQFGRKDPFLGSKYYDIHGVLFATKNKSKSCVKEQFDYTCKNPNMFLMVNAGDWCYQNPYENNPWYNPSWNPSPTGKSLFDPCPPGWTLPRGQVWSGILKAHLIIISNGVQLFCNGASNIETTWYPFAGYLYSGSCNYDHVGSDGYVYTRDRNGGAYFLRINNSDVLLSNNDAHLFVAGGGRAGGRSARCVQE